MHVCQRGDVNEKFDLAHEGRRIVLLCSWITGAIASAAIVGWLANVRALASFHDSSAPMAPTTAFNFVALSAALLLLDRPSNMRRIVARTCAFLAFVVALLHLGEVLLALTPLADSGQSTPVSRMALFTSVTFIFTSTSLLLLSFPPARRNLENIAGLFAVVSALLGLSFSTGYVLGTPILHGNTALPMTLSTAIAFFTLGSGILTSLFVKDLNRRRDEHQPRLAVDRKILTGFALALAAVLIVCILSYDNTVQAIDSMRLVVHTHEVLAETHGVFSAVKETESAARGYIITGNEDVLREFTSANQRVDEQLHRLRSLVRDNHAQVALIDSLEVLIRRKRQFNESVVVSYKHSGRAAAEQLIRPGVGIEIMAGIKEVIARLDEREQTLLRQRAAEQERTSRNMIVTFALLAALVVSTLAAIYVVVHRDLLGRQRAEEELRRASEEIRDLYNNAPCGYHSLNADGVFVAINDTELAWLGYTRDEVVGTLRFTDVISATSIPTFEKNFTEFTQRGFVNDLELEMKRKDGSTFFVSLSGTAIKDTNGNYLSSRSTMFDITPRKQAEGLFKNLLESAPDAIVIVDAQGSIKLMSQQVEAIFGYQREELYEKKVEILIPERFRENHPFYREAFLASPSARPMNVGLELCGLRKNGTEFPVEISLAKLGSGDNILVCAAIRDITERKKIENQIKGLNRDLERRAEELEAANRELEAFSYSVSHDLRTPLRHIDGFADLLHHHSADRLDEKGKRYLQTISTAAKQMGQLIDDLLAFSRVGRTEMVKTTVRLSLLVDETLHTLRSGEAKGRIIDWKIFPLPDVQGDPSLLRQVFVNLLANAVKYTRQCTHACIEIGSMTHGNDSEHILYVRDNGVGFDMSYAHKLFGVFQRLHSSSEFEGTGIGLANVRRIIARHGGRTWAEGEVGKGATFFFSLPA